MEQWCRQSWKDGVDEQVRDGKEVNKAGNVKETREGGKMYDKEYRD